MRPWDIYTWEFPDIGAHPAVIISHDEREELQEKGEQQQADMHAIHVGVGGDDDLIVAEAVEE